VDGMAQDKRPAWQEVTEETAESRYFVGTKD
jgi:hypothetical protein